MRTRLPYAFALPLLLAGCPDSNPCTGKCGQLDLAMAHDLAGRDLAGPQPDLSSGADLSAPGDLATPPDDSARNPGDQAMSMMDIAMQPVDLATTPSDLAGFDAAGFCAGTAVAGTCLQQVIAPASACFMPAGACTQDMANMTMLAACWANGAELQATFDMQNQKVFATWKQGATICMSAIATPDQTGQDTEFKLSVGGQVVSYDNGTGAVVCPDGTTTNVGANFGNCPDFNALMNPQFQNCGMGMCP